jgi:hypothetical protein
MIKEDEAIDRIKALSKSHSHRSCAELDHILKKSQFYSKRPLILKLYIFFIVPNGQSIKIWFQSNLPKP